MIWFVFAFPVVWLVVYYLVAGISKRNEWNRLSELSQANGLEEGRVVDWEVVERRLFYHQDRLGKAGYVELSERNKIKTIFLGFILFCSFVGFLFFLKSGLVASLLTFFIVGYLAFILVILYLRVLESRKENEILFRLPLFLESIILLVESGSGVMPAVNEVLNVKNKKNDKNPVTKLIRIVYELSAGGVPFGRALEQVSGVVDSKPLRHVFLHLDVSNSEGGALIPSLRSLSDYAHREWRLSVETRVKRLENLVVLPVFVSVLGLMILTIAVPIVPVVDFFGTIEQRKHQVTERTPVLGSRDK